MKSLWLSKQHIQLHPFMYGICIFLVICLAVFLFVFTFFPASSSDQVVNSKYSYETVQASNDVTIHVMRTRPEHIQLQLIHMNVVESGFDGINGGFFWVEQLLSIAVQNDIPVQGAANKYGSGWFNVKYPRGTLVYDRLSNELNVQIVSSVEDIIVTDRLQYWAQGGVSMNLSDPMHWEELMNVEALPFPNDSRLRSGMVYDKEGFVYLIISSTECTASQFRSAILELVHQYPLQEGIFLDGDGSSQMLANEIKLIGDGRKVTQMIRVN